MLWLAKETFDHLANHPRGGVAVGPIGFSQTDPLGPLQNRGEFIAGNQVVQANIPAHGIYLRISIEQTPPGLRPMTTKADNFLVNILKHAGFSGTLQPEDGWQRSDWSRTFPNAGRRQ